MSQARSFRHVPARWFETLPADVKHAVEEVVTSLRIAKGQAVIRQGDEARGLYGVVSGELQAIGTTTSGLDALIAIHRASDWFGFQACADQGEYAFSVVATCDSELQFLSLPAVERIFMQTTRTMKLFFAPQLSTTRSLFRHITEQLSYSPIQRLANRLLELAITPYAEHVPVSTLNAVTQEQLAFSTMHSRQWTNRLLRQLVDKGLISVSRTTIEIIDFKGLKNLADNGL